MACAPPGNLFSGDVLRCRSNVQCSPGVRRLPKAGAHCCLARYSSERNAAPNSAHSARARLAAHASLGAQSASAHWCNSACRPDRPTAPLEICRLRDTRRSTGRQSRANRYRPEPVQAAYFAAPGFDCRGPPGFPSAPNLPDFPPAPACQTGSSRWRRSARDARPPERRCARRQTAPQFAYCPRDGCS